MKRYVIAAISSIALARLDQARGGSVVFGALRPTLTRTSQQATNTAGNASSSNGNATAQSNDQSQTGVGGSASTADATTGGAGCCGSGDATSGEARRRRRQSQSADPARGTRDDAEVDRMTPRPLPRPNGRWAAAARPPTVRRRPAAPWRRPRRVPGVASVCGGAACLRRVPRAATEVGAAYSPSPSRTTVARAKTWVAS